MLERVVFTGHIARIENNCAVVITADCVRRYNLSYYRHMEDLSNEKSESVCVKQ